MTTQEKFQELLRKEEKAEEKNPLLELGLGDLVRESQRLFFRIGHYAFYKDFYKDITEIPERLKEDYIKYNSIIKELNRRESEESEYTRIPIQNRII